MLIKMCFRAHHCEGDECKQTGCPAVAEAAEHDRDEKRHGRTCARANQRLRGECGGNIAGEGIDEVRVGGEVDDNLFFMRTIRGTMLVLYRRI
jgi:hypothetical protein